MYTITFRRYCIIFSYWYLLWQVFYERMLYANLRRFHKLISHNCLHMWRSNYTSRVTDDLFTQLSAWNWIRALNEVERNFPVWRDEITCTHSIFSPFSIFIMEGVTKRERGVQNDIALLVQVFSVPPALGRWFFSFIHNDLFLSKAPLWLAEGRREAIVTSQRPKPSQA